MATGPPFRTFRAEFYQTPLGMRLLETTPVVSARGTQIGEAAIQPHLPELQRRLSEAMEATMGSPEQWVMG